MDVFPHNDEKEEGYTKNSVNLVAPLWNLLAPLLSFSLHQTSVEMVVHVNEAG
jgi:hypothetical protein